MMLGHHHEAKSVWVILYFTPFFIIGFYSLAAAIKKRFFKSLIKKAS
jgi:hypothetical protein